MISIHINGEPRQIQEGLTLSQLLSTLMLNPRAVAVELNRDVVDRERYDEVQVKEKDVIEIVHFVGGGAR